MKGLTLPFKYEFGVIVDGSGRQVLSANRNSLETPLNPTDRDNLLKLACILLNEAFQDDKAERILQAIYNR